MYIIIYILILGGYVSTNQTTSYVGEMLSSMQVLLLKEVSTYLTTNNSHEYFSSELTFRFFVCNFPLMRGFSRTKMRISRGPPVLGSESTIEQ